MSRNDHSNSGNLGRNTKALCCSFTSDFPPSTLALQAGSHSKLAFLPVLFLFFPLLLPLFLSCPLLSLLPSADLSHPDANPSPFASLWLCLEGQQQLRGNNSNSHCSWQILSTNPTHPPKASSICFCRQQIPKPCEWQQSHKPTIYCSLLQEVKVNTLPQRGL